LDTGIRANLFYVLNFGALPCSLFVYFAISVYSIDTIFILGDGLTRLLLRWEKSASFLMDFPRLIQGRGAVRDSNRGLPYSSPAL
jgi:hypothetical protein